MEEEELERLLCHRLGVDLYVRPLPFCRPSNLIDPSLTPLFVPFRSLLSSSTAHGTVGYLAFGAPQPSRNQQHRRRRPSHAGRTGQSIAGAREVAGHEGVRVGGKAGRFWWKSREKHVCRWIRRVEKEGRVDLRGAYSAAARPVQDRHRQTSSVDEKTLDLTSSSP